LQLIVHQKTNPECLRTAGKCYFFEYCHFESDNLNELKAHLKSKTSKHLEAIAVRVHELENVSTKSKDMVRICVIELDISRSIGE